MKILYIITVYKGSSAGGHYYSLKSTIGLVNQRNDCVIVNIGTGESPILSAMNIPIHNLIYSRKITSLIQVFKQLIQVINKENPDIIHAFDKQSLFFTMIMSEKFKIPYIVTRCGGPNPVYFPHVNNLIVYSNENKKYFESIRIAKNIFLISNRISKPVQNLVRIEKIRFLLKPGAEIFIRIARMSDIQKLSILESINLINRLNSDGIAAQLILIGTVQDRKIFKEISNRKNDNILILTEEEYTFNANQLINAGEYVIGAGRSFMEAASLGKVMLCPVQNSDIPLLITSENFQEAFDLNFSSRVTIGNFNPEKNYQMILKAISDKNYSKGLKDFIKDMSRMYFEIESQGEILQKIYSNLKYSKSVHLLDLLIQTVLIMKNFWLQGTKKA